MNDSAAAKGPKVPGHRCLQSATLSRNAHEPELHALAARVGAHDETVVLVAGLVLGGLDDDEIHEQLREDASARHRQANAGMSRQFACRVADRPQTNRDRSGSDLRLYSVFVTSEKMGT